MGWLQERAQGISRRSPDVRYGRNMFVFPEIRQALPVRLLWFPQGGQNRVDIIGPILQVGNLH